MEVRYLPYFLENGPSATDEQVEAQGANCQWLVHHSYRLIDIELPPWLRSAEIFACTEGIFVPVDSIEKCLT